MPLAGVGLNDDALRTSVCGLPSSVQTKYASKRTTVVTAISSGHVPRASYGVQWTSGHPVHFYDEPPLGETKSPIPSFRSKEPAEEVNSRPNLHPNTWRLPDCVSACLLSQHSLRLEVS